ncbi:MAG: hemerythrin domain-containing protein [Brachybacterium sp.]|nr:hemerythrin domain-containing protein [Brachybacterium sp.]MDN5899494.1 hemerythrin domain-containing protein [Brachybacterium sp.]
MTMNDAELHEEPALSVAAAFTREHHQIDDGIEAFLADTAEHDPARRARPLLTAMEALRRHIYLEEEVVFPRLAPGPLMMPLMVMRREHGELWERMDALAEILEDDSSAASGIADACTELLSLLEDHNRKEEPIIYPHLDTDLTPEEQSLVRELLAGETLPEDWTCQALR